MSKQEALDFARKIIKKYEDSGMVADVIAWQTILYALTGESE